MFLAGYIFPTAYHSPSCLCLFSMFPAQDPPFPDATVDGTWELAAYLNYRQACIQPRLAPLQKEMRKVITHGCTQRRLHVSFQPENQEPTSPRQITGNQQPTWLVVIIDFDAGWFQVLHLNYLFQLQSESLRFIIELVEMEGN